VPKGVDDFRLASVNPVTINDWLFQVGSHFAGLVDDVLVVYECCRKYEHSSFTVFFYANKWNF